MSEFLMFFGLFALIATILIAGGLIPVLGALMEIRRWRK